MRCMVTGAAGFIGSHLCDRLLADGATVLGLDCFTPYYSRQQKERNLAAASRHSDFRFIEADLVETPLDDLVSEVDTIFHLAAQAGVRASWGREFAAYTNNNVLATQRLLEACRNRSLNRIIIASSSSVYGDCDELPMREDSPLRPVSPYGITKVATEHLASLYAGKFKAPAVCLRFFTVYGPRQRPDMAFHRFIRQMQRGEEIEVFGDGSQSRDFTYVDDVVESVIQSAERGVAGTVYNIGGGTRVTLREALETLATIVGTAPRIRRQAVQPGDMRHTLADITKAHVELEYAPRVQLSSGLQREVAWLKEGVS